MHPEAFASAVRSSDLAPIYQRYTAVALATVLTKDWPRATQAEAELLLAAIAVVETGKGDEVAHADQERMFRTARKILDARDFRYGPLMSALRNIRNLRPAWFSGPLYAELLRPFEAEAKDILGVSIDQVFELAVAIEDRKGGGIQAIPEPLLEEVAIKLTDINTPGDIWSKCVVLVDEKKYALLLSEKAVDTFYRGILHALQKTSSRFGTRKGAALEEFVRRRVEKFAPAWHCERNGAIGGKEKDLVCWDSDTGLAIESKSLRLRGSARDWSARDLESDIAEVGRALEQIQPSLGLLRAGGMLDSGQPVPSRPNVHGIIVTDEPFTAYVRSAVDRLPFDPDKDVKDWHGADVWITSFLDFHYCLEVTRTPSVLLHYLRTWRSHSIRRFDDEPECLSAYSSTFGQLGVKRGVQLKIPEADWKMRRSKPLEAFGPEWLSRWPEISRWDRFGRSAMGQRLIEQDIASAERSWRATLQETGPSTPEDNAQTAALAEKITETMGKGSTKPAKRLPPRTL